MRLMWCLCLVVLCTHCTQASTHWMVTESGLIQPKLESPFEMARPYDLLAFLKQDTRWDSIISLYHDITKRQEAIKFLWEKLDTDSDVLAHIAEDKNCVKAGPVNILDWYNTVLEDGKTKFIPEEEYWLNNPYTGHESFVPDCKKISSLTFSMFAFEHLEGMIKRQNLSIEPELTLPEQISPIMTVDQFGTWLANILQQNSSSWLHYNMASLFWRVRGNAPKALECSRRAVHYAPREYKDIALLGMGTIFHRSKMPEDAITLLGAAVDHDPKFPLHHFMLANAYGVVGDFNSSLKHLDASLKLHPTSDPAIKHRYGIICHAGLVHYKERLQETFKKLREELVEYIDKERDWVDLQAMFLKTMNDYDLLQIEDNCAKMGELTGLDFVQLKKSGDMNTLIQHFLDGPLYDDKWVKDKGVHALESLYTLQRLIKHIQKHATTSSDIVIQSDPKSRIIKEIEIKLHDMRTTEHENEARIIRLGGEKKASSQIEDDGFEYEGRTPILYPPTMKVSRNTEDFDKDSDWPSDEFCLEAAHEFPKNLETIYPVFLPFENKGISVGKLLTEKLGVPADVEYELPWHPPTCPYDAHTATFTQKRAGKQVADRLAGRANVEYELPWHPPTCPYDAHTTTFTRKRAGKQVAHRLAGRADVEYKLPWHPPTCPYDAHTATFTQKRAGKQVADRLAGRANVEYELPWHPPTCPYDAHTTTFTRKRAGKQVAHRLAGRADVEYKLPWHPPTCPYDAHTATFTQKRAGKQVADRLAGRADVEYELPWHPPTCPYDAHTTTFTRKRAGKQVAHRLAGRADVEYKLPWHPPTCPYDAHTATFTQKRAGKQVADRLAGRADIEYELPWHPPTCPYDAHTTTFTRKRAGKQVAHRLAGRADVEYKLPWHPPTCPYDAHTATFTQKRAGKQVADRLAGRADIEYELPWHPPTCPYDAHTTTFTRKRAGKLAGRADVEYKLPWHPPTCPYDAHTATFTQKRAGKQVAHRLAGRADVKYKLPWHPPTCPYDAHTATFTQKRAGKQVADRLAGRADVEYMLPWHPPMCPYDAHTATFTQKRAGKQVADRLAGRADVEYELPWHPPTCPYDAHTATFTQKRAGK
ncbi:uncharacterized protein LOC125229077 [Leguminivora glycinivorella]|uniref:uncharacterized protein LOC125229077 n=1 Tax=Leguminivora glycinivorella TaxID=1035111 RepID=UPI002010BB13|nr:uncharacterized protein LOC125229077 [Leguminivora glycinivorella]